MKITPWYLVALSPFAVLGFTGAFTAQFALLVVVLGIFFGTLSLNRFTSTTTAADEQTDSGV
jgi:hypothetical protein